MSLTVTDIQTRARERYNAVGDNFYSDKMLRDLIFDGQQILALEGWVIEKTFSTPSVDETREYSYPTTTLGIKEIRYNNEKLTKRKLSADPRTSLTDPTGRPRSYAIWEDTIILFPTPDTAGDTIKVKTYAYPDDLTSNTDPIQVPEEFKESLIVYLLAWMSSKDQNLQLQDRYQNIWDTTVQRVKKQRQKRLRGDQNTRVSDLYFGTDTPPNVEDVFYHTRGY